MTVAKTNKSGEKMGTVPAQQIACVKTLCKMQFAEQINYQMFVDCPHFFLKVFFSTVTTYKESE
jgi:hypothetical protein